MARVLYDGLVEYEDGTPATTSQMAKDVVQFLNWAAEPEMDQRKKMGMKVIIISSVLVGLSIWVKRYKWAPIKARKIVSSRDSFIRQAWVWFADLRPIRSTTHPNKNKINFNSAVIA